MSNQEALKGRHPATAEKMLWFEYEHLPLGGPQEISSLFSKLAWRLVDELCDGPQFTIALDKLREAKDRAVSQAIVDGRNKKEERNVDS
jgi:hypothetical protein